MQFVATQLQSQQANFHGSMLLGRFLGPTYPYAILYGITEIPRSQNFQVKHFKNEHVNLTRKIEMQFVATQLQSQQANFHMARCFWEDSLFSLTYPYEANIVWCRSNRSQVILEMNALI